MLNTEKIRILRQKKNYTLNQVSKETGYTPSFLSQIERGIRLPSVEALRKISQCLDVPIFTFLQDSLSDIADGEITNDLQPFYLIKKDNRKILSLPESDIEYELLTPFKGCIENRILIFGAIAKMRPGSKASNSMVMHNLEETTFLLKGSIKVFIEDEVVTLNEGDSIYLHKNAPHIWVNDSTEDALIINYFVK